jgi:hypothetical protein
LAVGAGAAEAAWALVDGVAPVEGRPLAPREAEALGEADGEADGAAPTAGLSAADGLGAPVSAVTAPALGASATVTVWLPPEPPPDRA